MKHLYYIFLTISLIAGTLPLKAELFSTASHPIELSNCYSTEPAFRSTSCYQTSYQLPSGGFQSSIQFANGQIQTAAARLNGNILADEGGYIDTYQPTGPQRSIAPPTIAPIGFGWDVVVFMLMLCLAYALYLRKKMKTH